MRHDHEADTFSLVSKQIILVGYRRLISMCVCCKYDTKIINIESSLNSMQDLGLANI